MVSPGEASVQAVGFGHYAMSADLADLIDRVDGLLRSRLSSAFGGRAPVTEWRYPVLLSAEALRRSGYAENFPHLVSVVAPTGGSDDERRRLVEESASGDPRHPFPVRLFRDADFVLPPTMCLHIYEHLRLTGSDPLSAPVVTARGPAFRREVDESAPLTRLSGFHIRECVFFGTRTDVRGQLEVAQGLAEGVAHDLGIAARLAPASDAFFANPIGEQNRRAQLVMKAKVELLVRAADREVAAASFNFSGRRFVEAYELAAPDGVVSGCLGFGLERLAYALVSSHGSVAAARSAVPA